MWAGTKKAYVGRVCMFEGNLSFHLATETQEEYAARILPRTQQLIPPEGVARAILTFEPPILGHLLGHLFVPPH